MLQESAPTGVLFLAGLFAGSVAMASGAILGAAAGVVAARLAGLSADDTARGLHGFNAALVGIAMLAFHPPGLLSIGLIVLGGAASTLLMEAMRRRVPALPPYTAPFVLTGWVMLAIAGVAGLPPAAAAGAPLPAGELPAVLRGIGQVMFQDSWLAGLLFTIGLALHSRQAAAWALIGSALGLVTARSLGFPEHLSGAGIHGFNGALAGIALGDRYRGNVAAPLAGIVLSTLLVRAFQLAGFPALTAPFVLSTWVVSQAYRSGARTR